MRVMVLPRTIAASDANLGKNSARPLYQSPVVRRVLRQRGHPGRRRRRAVESNPQPQNVLCTSPTLV
jgi:hypothetical protein